MKDFEERFLNKEDAFDIVALEKSSFKNPWPLSQIEYELLENPCSKVIGIYSEGVLQAYLDFMITFDSATINRIAVKEDARRKGLASKLLKQMEKICLGKEDKVETITLEVRKSNIAAHSLYLKMGYQDITIKKMYYDDGEDAIYMMRSLL